MDRSKQLLDLAKAYSRLDNLEDKVSNVKERIFLMQKHLGPSEKDVSIIKVLPIKETKVRTSQDIEYDLLEMKKKFHPVDPYQQMAEEADNDLERALKKALENQTK